MPMRYRDYDFDSARWNGFVHRPGDIVISTPSKSGTTLMQMLCALLVFDGPVFPDALDRVSPWLDHTTRPVAEVIADLEAQTHRRFIKTHTPLDGLPFEESVMYLMVGRDPRDVAVSYEHHRANLDRERLRELIGPDESLRHARAHAPVDDVITPFIETDGDPATAPITLAGVLDHLRTGWERRRLPNVALFHFTDLTADPVGEMAALASVLGIEVPAARLSELAGDAHIDRMRSRADELTPGASLGHWKDTKVFFRSGATGEWRHRMSDAQQQRYAARVAELAAPDLAEWVHNGRCAS